MSKVINKEETPNIAWNRIMISTRAITSFMKTAKIKDEDKAFDILAEILEAAAIHGELLDIDEGYYTFRLENFSLVIKDNELRKFSKITYPVKLRKELHYAEDGRCEKCGQPLDITAMRIKRRSLKKYHDFMNYQVLCPDCANKKKNALEKATFTERSIKLYAEQRGITEEEANQELMASKEGLILVKMFLNSRKYWGNGLGTFSLFMDKLDFLELYVIASPIKRSPQARTRKKARKKDK